MNVMFDLNTKALMFICFLCLSLQAQAFSDYSLDIPTTRLGKVNSDAGTYVRTAVQTAAGTPFVPVNTTITATFTDGYIQTFVVSNSRASSDAVTATSNATHPGTGATLNSNGDVTGSGSGSGGGGSGGGFILPPIDGGCGMFEVCDGF
jgi:hypothetical protein